MHEASDWSRDDDAVTPDEMVEDALRFSLDEGKGRGREWLRNVAISSGYSDRFINSLMRRYNDRLKLLEAELLCNTGRGDIDYEESTFYLNEKEDTLIPSYVAEAITWRACMSMDFTQEQTELMVLRGEGVTREQLAQCPPPEWTAADVERVWRQISRKIAEPRVKSAFRQQLHRAQDAVLNQLSKATDNDQEVTLKKLL